MLIPFYKNPDLAAQRALWRRPELPQQDLSALCADVFGRVREGGDAALLQLTRQFDNKEVRSIRLGAEALEELAATVPQALRRSIRKAATAIEIFHRAQLRNTLEVQTLPGVRCSLRRTPIESVGLYIPGGSAPLLSTVLMLAIPAAVAGCSRIVLCTPPSEDGTIAPAIAAAALCAGVREIFAVGGIQAIAAMTLGTETIPKVDKLFGPGNQYVSAAKEYARTYKVSYDTPAGPSEVLVIGDAGMPPAFAAADMLAQAEHGADSQVMVVSHDEAWLREVTAEVERLLADLPRAQTARAALAHSAAVLLNDAAEIADFANGYAPEHLIICHGDQDFLAHTIRRAGSVFLGAWSPESAGDYASGTNHTLPTGGWAASYSGVSTDAFLRTVTYQTLSRDGLAALASTVAEMARAEGLEAHARAVEIRMQSSHDVEQHSEDVALPVRPDLADFVPYSSARSEYQGRATLFLDANENPFASAYQRYPDPLQSALRRRLAELRGVAEDNVLVGNGSDELIDLIVRAFCVPGVDSVGIFPPTYGMYATTARLNGCLLAEGSTDADFVPLASSLSARMPKVTFLCRPNNPTGTVYPISTILEVAASTNGIVVVDEAYIEFSDAESADALVRHNPRIAVLHTLSKAYGGAGIRLGYVVAHPRMVQILKAIKPPYNVGDAAAEAAHRLLDDAAATRPQVRLIVEERELLRQQLAARGFAVYPGQGNFVLARHPQAARLCAALRRGGIIVRDRSSEPGLQNCLRITVGTPGDNTTLLNAIDQELR